MKVIAGKEKEYQDWKEKNQDSYGKGVFDFAERWAESLETLIESSDESSLDVIIAHAGTKSNEADTKGITGFMYGMAVSILSQEWEYGEDLRVWHNKEWGYTGDGVVNPALMTISVKN